MEYVTLQQVQDILYNILCEVDDVCQKEKVPYMLAGGTGIGAVRHHDIIPWDDDIDIVVWDKDYPAMEAALRKHLPPHLKLTKPEDLVPNFYDFTIRVQDTRYNWHEPTDVDLAYDNKQNLLCVDIFVLSGSGNNALEKKLYTLEQTLIYVLSRGHRLGKGEPVKGVVNKVVLGAFAMVGKLIPMRLLARWHSNWRKRLLRRDTVYCALLNAIPSEFGLHYKSEWFKGPAVLMKFRDRMLPMPSGYHEYLTACYGDYMQPPKDKSIYIQHFSEENALEK